MPKIGRRILKSSLAVFLCFAIYELRGQEGIVFYSCIAAVLCMQQDVTNSKRVAFNRIKGTFLGGFIGMFVLLFEQSFLPTDLPLLAYLLVSLMIIVIIYLTVLLKMTSASYISCVVFMSITVSHGMDVNPYLFAINRMIDTLIGIFVALGLNVVHLPHRHHQTSLFVSDLSDMCDDLGELTSFTKIKLRQLLEQGANITITSAKTPAAVLPLLKEIPQFSLPLIVMNGTAMYDLNTQEYTHCCYLDKEILVNLLPFFTQAKVNCFVHTIRYQMLHVYYTHLNNPVEEDYYHQMRCLPYQNYICHEVVDLQKTLYFIAMEKQAVLEELKKQIECSEIAQSLTIELKQDLLHTGYAHLEIYSAKAGKQQAIDTLMQSHHYTKLYTFGSRWETQSQMKQSQHYRQDDVVRQMEKCYRRRSK